MYSHHQLINIVIVLIFNGALLACTAKDVPFDINYSITYGNDHVVSLNQGREIQLSMDIHSGKSSIVICGY